MHDQPKLCECGCGQPAPIAKMSDARRGLTKGQPQRFVNGHVIRTFSEETRRKLGDGKRGSTLSDEHRRKISETKQGARLSPEHRRSISVAHGGTGEPKPAAIHRLLARRYPKTGVCEECGTAGKTDYAFKCHPAPHTTNRADYRELCDSCHKTLDYSLGQRRPNRSRM